MGESTATERRERPILFSDEMVRAILDGRKTQTRRVVTPQNSKLGSGRWQDLDFDGAYPDLLWGVMPGLKVPTSNAPPEHCPECVVRLYPRIEPGDRLWVREAWSDVNLDSAPGLAYRADGEVRDLMEEPSFLDRNGAFNYDDPRAQSYEWADWYEDLLDGNGRWRPSIHMPRWASRITLEVTDVRAERVQEISEAGVAAEGFRRVPSWRTRWFMPGHDWHEGAIPAFRELWDSLNAHRGHGWDENPWVWVITFDPHTTGGE